MNTSSRNASHLRALRCALALLVFLLPASAAFAQSAPIRSGGQQAYVIFKAPGGYMGADYPEHKTGKLLLDPKRPDGMFVVYLNDDETPEAFTEQLKNLIAEMFYHQPDFKPTWTASTVPAHTTMSNETGTLWASSDGKMEVQLASYLFTLSGKKIAYGYFAMQHAGKRHSDDGRFLDSSGGGVKDFEKLWKSIEPSK
ncbi:MAG: hypothetical protein JO360_13815 [Acidobacteria bacterium]|nr:hypothetical protein [Acidobacteriota bacterium]